jgi:hypothetical protein
MRGANEALPAVQVRRRRARNAHRHRRSEAADSAEEARHEQQYGGLNRVSVLRPYYLNSVLRITHSCLFLLASPTGFEPVLPP